ncbi:DUF233 protein, partial [Operophtera brumata]
PCSASDPSLNQCVEKVISVAGPLFADGIPALGIAPLDPVQLGTVNVDSPALKIIFTDTKGKAILDFTANVTLKAHYDMNGQILILPIRGNGQAKIKITNLNIVVKYDFETREGHWVITGYKDHYKMDRAQFKFQNLFNGNQQLASTTERFTNENWQIIMSEIAPGAIKQIIQSCVDKVQQFFSAIPAKELLLQSSDNPHGNQHKLGVCDTGHRARCLRTNHQSLCGRVQETICCCAGQRASSTLIHTTLLKIILC